MGYPLEGFVFAGGEPVAPPPMLIKRLIPYSGIAFIGLDYLLGIMRDKDQGGRSRLDAAKAAAPYRHARLSSTELSGPERQCRSGADISKTRHIGLKRRRTRYIGTCASEDDRVFLAVLLGLSSGFNRNTLGERPQD